MSRTIWLALSEAKHGAVLHRREREQAEQFRTVLTYTAEGLIATDMTGQIEVSTISLQRDNPDIYDEIAHTVANFLDKVSENTHGSARPVAARLAGKAIYAVGRQKVVPYDFRIISATNNDLLPEVQILFT